MIQSSKWSNDQSYSLKLLLDLKQVNQLSFYKAKMLLRLVPIPAHFQENGNHGIELKDDLKGNDLKTK